MVPTTPAWAEVSATVLESIDSNTVAVPGSGSVNVPGRFFR